MSQALAGFVGALEETDCFQSLPQAPCSRRQSLYISWNVLTVVSIFPNSGQSQPHCLDPATAEYSSLELHSNQKRPFSLIFDERVHQNNPTK